MYQEMLTPTTDNRVVSETGKQKHTVDGALVSFLLLWATGAQSCWVPLRDCRSHLRMVSQKEQRCWGFYPPTSAGTGIRTGCPVCREQSTILQPQNGLRWRILVLAVRAMVCVNALCQRGCRRGNDSICCHSREHMAPSEKPF